MQTIIQFVQTKHKDRTKEITLRKMNKLAEKYSWIIRAEDFYKENNDTVDNKICEIRLSVPGPRIFAESKASTHKAALTETINDLEIQLKKKKGQMMAHV